MAIDLKRLDRFGLSPEFQVGILAQDRNRNDILEESDFEAFYGKTATEQYYPQLEEAVRRNDAQRFSELLHRMEEYRNQTIGSRFSGAVERCRSLLEQEGVSVDDSEIDLHLSGDGGFQRAQRGSDILSSAFLEAFAQEFSDAPAAGPLRQHLQYALMKQRGHFDIHAFGIQMMLDMTAIHQEMTVTGTMVERGSDLWNQPGAEIDQRSSYAPTQYYEYRQPPHITELERRFSIDIRIGGKMLSPQQTEVLGVALERLRALRPGDFQYLKTLRVEENPERVGGETIHPHTVKMEGAFGSPLSSEGIRYFPQWYSEELSAAFCAPDPQDFIIKVLAHELGHLVYHHAPVPAYEAFLQGSSANEPFAEDYSILILSDGERVARSDPTGKTTRPFYAERLAYMRAHFMPAAP